MASVTAAMVKELREKTGAGMMDCKSALNESGGDMQAAIDWLRKKGLSKAAKKAGRIAAEGLVAVTVRGHDGVIVEVNSETDFVARNEEFQALVRSIALVAIERGTTLEALKDTHYPGGDTVAAAVANAVATIGENIALRRVANLHVPHGVIGQYVHTAVAEGLGKIGVIAALTSIGKPEELTLLGRQIAMHIAATNPLALDSDRIDPAVIEREKAILAGKHQGKPPQVVAKIVDSGLKSYFNEVCLLDQVSTQPAHDGKTIRQTLKEAETKVGAAITISGFHRFALGEGIDKPGAPDFAAVAS
jgi:elongation factor Ts